MKKIVILFVSLSCLNSYSWTNRLDILGVYMHKDNQYASGNFNNYQKCSIFRGTYHKNSILFRPSVVGSNARFSHTVVLKLNEGYLESHGRRSQREYSITHGKSMRITFPELRDDVSFVQQSVMLISRNLDTDETRVVNKVFNISRPVVLTKSTRPEALDKECHQVYGAYQSPIGILSNSSSNPSQLSIKQGVQRLWTSLRGAQWGFYFSPLAWLGIGNVFSVYKNYFQQYSKQVIETVEVSSNYQISPGDFVQIYEQRTRYVSAFDATLVHACGESESLDGEYMMQWWGVAYHPVPVDPYSEEEIPVDTIGSYPMNNCSDEYSPEFGSEFNFLQTNF